MNSGLRELKIPSSVTRINTRDPFSDTPNLKTVIFEDGTEPLEFAINSSDDHSKLNNVFYKSKVTSVYIGRLFKFTRYDQAKYGNSYPFSGVTRDISISFGNSVPFIQTLTFYGFSGLKQINLSSSITAIGEYAFSNCTGLSKIDLSPSVEVIGKCAFNGCSGLKDLIIGNSVTRIYDTAFTGCTGLLSVTIGAGIEEFTIPSVRNLTITKGSKPIKLTIDKSKLEVLNLARNIESGSNPFQNCPALTTVKIMDGCTSVNDGMFKGCGSLKSATIPASVGYVGEGAFYATSLQVLDIEDGTTPLTIEFSVGGGNTFGSGLNTLYLGRNITYNHSELSPFMESGISTLTIGNKVTEINDYLFYGCSGISMFSIPASVKRVGNYAFYDCKGSSSLMLSGSVETIGDYAFYNCSGLSRISIPKSVTSVGKYAFRNCSRANSISLGSSLKSIGEYAFLDCYNATKITFGNSLETIGSNAFYNCSACTELVLPNSLKTIGDNAFGLCSDLETLVIGDGVTSIGMSAFADCEKLQDVTIGGSVNEIGGFAFFNCDNIKTLSVKNPVPPVADESVFTDYSATLYVQRNSASAYKNAHNDCWPLFGNIQEKDMPISGVIALMTEDNGTTEYYNLQGVRFSDKSNLAPGIYVVKSGGVTRKVVVK